MDDKTKSQEIREFLQTFLGKADLKASKKLHLVDLLIIETTRYVMDQVAKQAVSFKDLAMQDLSHNGRIGNNPSGPGGPHRR